MDSLTQIVLGAAVGEVVLGKKIGNKAMLWGAIAGTLPDLDVYLSLFFDRLTANELHRGFSHSIVFSLVISPVLAWLLLKREKILLAILVALILAYPALSTGNPWIIGAVFALYAICFYFIQKNDYTLHIATGKEWTKLFFWCLVTHPILDCHTTWGTQLLWPLPYKFAWNNIFVLDPLYTIPFLVFVALAMFYHRESKKRAMLNFVGIALSSIYMLWSLGAKLYTYRIFEHNLQKQAISYTRLTTVPTPLNTFLWSATAEADSVYYTGLYSVFDKDDNVVFNKINHRQDLVSDLQDQVVMKRLNLLSKGWYVINNDNPDTLVYNDARFGPMYVGDKPMYGFGYRILDAQSTLHVDQQRPDIDKETGSKLIATLWDRIWGK